MALDNPGGLMEQIGRTLREAREVLGLTLEEVERATRIRVHHLAALEEGDLEALPSPVQARGFLKNYAEFLGLDIESVLLRYADVLQARRNRPRGPNDFVEPITRPAVRVRSRRPRWLSADLFVAAAITLAVIVVLIWGLGRVMATLRERTEEDQAELAFLRATTTASPSPTVPLLEISPGTPATVPVLEGTASPTPPVIVVPENTVDVRLVAEHSAWVRVVVDGKESYRGRVFPGQLLEYLGQQVVEVTTGNGAGIRVFYNGQDQGTLGGLGEVVIRLWTLGGAVTPTATQTRTPTVTPRISNTPRPSATPGP